MISSCYRASATDIPFLSHRITDALLDVLAVFPVLVRPLHLKRGPERHLGRAGSNSRETYARADQRQHNPLVQGQSFALLHLDPLLVQAFHGVHLARVRFAAAVDFAETTAAYDPVNAEVVHR